MDDLFLRTAGLFLENLTSEILRCILSDENYEIYQRIFFNYLFKNNDNKSTFDYGFEIFQERYGSEIPDIVLKTDNEIIFIENKFYAPYVGGNQISRYIKVLNTRFQNLSKKSIYLLTIKKRQNHYHELIAYDVSKNLGEKERIDVKFIFWEEILGLFKSNDFLIQNLNRYIQDTFLLSVTFSEKEMEMLKEKDLPHALNNLYRSIDQIRNELSQRREDKIRASQSFQYYGFYIELEKIGLYFGYFFPLWLNPPDKSNVTPIYLQVKGRNIKPQGPKLDESTLQICGFIKTQIDDEWVKPFNLDLLKNISDFVETLNRDLKEVNDTIM